MLAAVAFVESSVFPIPPDVLLIPMVTASRNSAWRYAAICTVASVLGGMLGYAIGTGLYEGVGRPIQVSGCGVKFSDFWRGTTIRRLDRVYGWRDAVPTGDAIASGVTNLIWAHGASVLARGLRFFVVAALLYYIGQPIREFIEKRLGLMFALLCAADRRVCVTEIHTLIQSAHAEIALALSFPNIHRTIP